MSNLRHIDKPSTNFMGMDNSTTDAANIVKRYLGAMENRDLALAGSFLTTDFTMTFPGGVVFSSLQQLVDWSKTRYQSVGKTYEQFDLSQSDDKTIVYCYGTLNGAWLDGSRFSGIRFIDRFVVVGGLLQSQLVWNDLAETTNNP